MNNDEYINDEWECEDNAQHSIEHPVLQKRQGNPLPLGWYEKSENGESEESPFCCNIGEERVFHEQSQARFAISVIFRVSDRRNRDEDGMLATVMDCLIFATRRFNQICARPDDLLSRLRNSGVRHRDRFTEVFRIIKEYDRKIQRKSSRRIAEKWNASATRERKTTYTAADIKRIFGSGVTNYEEIACSLGGKYIEEEGPDLSVRKKKQRIINEVITGEKTRTRRRNSSRNRTKVVKRRRS